MNTTRPPSLDTVLIAIASADEDRLDALVDATIAVARPNLTTVVLGYVFEPDGYPDLLDRLAYDDADDVTPDDVAARQAGVKRARDRLAGTGLDITVRGAVNDRGAGIVTLAEDTDADRVVVGGRNRSPTGKALFGSTAQEVLLHAPCPTTLVRGD